eukprot:CAMPEP_0117665356 /NCGR_PEP_ID=MMETSP0804-20121206/9765_1 /TAXON_ID=1074897 /ORGANISM="Tetraselmis astigmatica, Strain CCMP880" /LENGTH=177 /DNA_ID=CAMNT_0005472761 /DNA_START=125 /DNA_END=658 /DNA_ORIENTATION=-
MNSTGVGRLISLAGRLGRLFSRREQVGVDAAGNKYFRWTEKGLDGEPVEKRVCEYADDDYDPTSVPPIWKSWLQGTFQEPPTEEDIRKVEQRSAQLKERVATLEMEEKQRHFKARSLQDVGQENHSNAAMTALLGGEHGRGQSRQAAEDSGAGSAAEQPAPASSTFRPESWQPGGTQ